MSDVQVYLHSARGARKRVGDVLLSGKEDSAGSRNRAGNHTNLGYSGYIQVRVWSGKRWCWLNHESKDRFSTESERRYQVKYKMHEVMTLLREKILRHVADHGWKPEFYQREEYWAASLS